MIKFALGKKSTARIKIMGNLSDGNVGWKFLIVDIQMNAK